MTDAKTDSDANGVPASRKSARRRWRWPLALVLVLVFLIFDIGPTVPAPGPPSARQTEAGHGMVQRTLDTLAAGNGRAWLRYTGMELDSAAVLAGNIRKLGQFDAQLAKDRARFRMSQQLLGPVWINITADVRTTIGRFPPVSLRIGRLPLGETLSRKVIELAQWGMRKRGINTPPLDDLITLTVVKPETFTTILYLPKSGDVGRGLFGLSRNPVDATAAARIYCGVMKQESEQTTEDFAQVVNRAFAVPSGLGNPAETNRAAFVALAAYTVGPSAMQLAPGMREKIASCPQAFRTPRIVGRDDLPKHWSLSAALSVTLGDDVSAAMGQWKELSDSRPNGTGFSFVDLAADRSGLAAARRATDPAGASAFAARLRTATPEQIIPIGALALSEGLTEAQFVARYGTIDSKAFAAATARVDRVIARTVGE